MYTSLRVPCMPLLHFGVAPTSIVLQGAHEVQHTGSTMSAWLIYSCLILHTNSIDSPWDRAQLVAPWSQVHPAGSAGAAAERRASLGSTAASRARCVEIVSAWIIGPRPDSCFHVNRAAFDCGASLDTDMLLQTRDCVSARRTCHWSAQT